MIPYHCDICDTKFVSTASFEIQKKETRLEFSSEILLVKTISYHFVESGIGVMGRLTLFVHVPYS